jgi:hypothetical protein
MHLPNDGQTYGQRRGDNHHSPWRISIVAHDAVRKTTMVCSNTHGSSILLALLNQWSKDLKYIEMAAQVRTPRIHFYGLTQQRASE